MKKIPKIAIPFFLITVFLIITGYSTYSVITSLEPHFNEFHDEKTHAIIALGEIESNVLLMSLELLEFEGDQHLKHRTAFDQSSINLLDAIEDYRIAEHNDRDIHEIDKISFLSSELISFGNILILTIESESSSKKIIHESFEIFDEKAHEIHEIIQMELIHDKEELIIAGLQVTQDIEKSYLLIFFLTFSSIFVILAGGYILNSQIQKQEELEKLSVMTKVARSVGHDLRNPLTAIKSAGYLLKSKVSPIDKHLLNLIDNNVNLADEMIHELMDFAKEEKLNFVVSDIEKIIKQTLSQIIIPPKITLNTSFQTTSQINIDEYQIIRSLTNLINNALDSIQNRGNLYIFTTEINDFIEIEIRDSGKGIPDSDLHQLFTPFYTTKAKGMGLGLVNVKRIVELHKGKIELKSKVGEGTSVTLKIPVYHSS